MFDYELNMYIATLLKRAHTNLFHGEFVAEECASKSERVRVATGAVAAIVSINSAQFN